MKILIYNWAQFDDAGLAGGGVTVYLRNVIDELLRRKDVTVYFLSAGRHYRAFRTRPRIEQTENVCQSDRLLTFSLLNSPIKAPAHDAFYSIARWREDRGSVDLVRDFIRQHGPFDAMHVHNLEGIGAKVLSMPKGADLKRMFYTIHNYMPFCPQIELLYNGRQVCGDYREGHRCVGCLAHENNMNDLVSWARVGSMIDISKLSGHPVGGFLFDMLSAGIYLKKAVRNLFNDTRYGLKTRFQHWHRRHRTTATQVGWEKTPSTPPVHAVPLDRRVGTANDYRLWRETNVAALATNLDGVFAVSDIARDAALRFMPPGSVIETLVLPIDVDPSAAARNRLRSRKDGSGDVTLSFVGYDIPSKGLPFLIDALADLDDPFFRSRVNLLVVARLGSERARQLYQLERQFKSVRVVPSYRRDQLQELSGMIDLNVVPSIWLETFNQVTVELGRLGVPSLVSSTVGARQAIVDQDTFVFDSANAADFRFKLDRLVKTPDLRARFFDQDLAIPSLASHVDVLLQRYAGIEAVQPQSLSRVKIA